MRSLATAIDKNKRNVGSHCEIVVYPWIRLIKNQVDITIGRQTL